MYTVFTMTNLNNKKLKNCMKSCIQSVTFQTQPVTPHQLSLHPLSSLTRPSYFSRHIANQESSKSTVKFSLLLLTKMPRSPVFVLSCLITFLILALSCVGESADDPNSAEVKEAVRPVFMPESDASTFFKRRSRRSVRYYEQLAEQRVFRANAERRREYNEEQRNEYENYAEEDRTEQQERTREKYEQVREYNYDGRYPRFHWFH
ncbi:upper zone of growth plate and cartilage matrix associated a isoform X2 [Corythoichthys intestinalis]|uniref:upper zone of growth plate and cartilage matrix associated a isoform X2 n=1 Tax=Corythoichthys intestinalis TaxID=161448 RepID=UPI0025A59583|nr:upper zone of growth plate and cartilage matrix associated a isoform X2 [Corythoichthys intestinalis]